MARSRRTRSEATEVSVPEVPPHEAGDSEHDDKTTGRFIVVFKDDAIGKASDVKKAMSNVAGMKDLALASDYSDSAVTAEDLSDTEA